MESTQLAQSNILLTSRVIRNKLNINSTTTSK